MQTCGAGAGLFHRLLIAVLTAGVVFGATTCTAAGAWDLFETLSMPDPADRLPFDSSSHTYFHELVFANASSGQDLNDFPVMIVLTPARVDYTAINPDGSDIRFADGDTGEELAYEVELWSHGGTSLLRVNVPQIDAGSATDTIVLYYGHAEAASGEDVAGVWNGDYLGVWHLDNSAVVNDSTANGNAGTNSGTTVSPDRLGLSGAKEFDGTSSIIIANESAFDMSGPTPGLSRPFTVEAWALKQGGSDQFILAKTQLTGNNRSYAIGFNLGSADSGAYVETSSDGNHNPEGFVEMGASVPDDSWIHVGAVYTGTETILYVDGAEIGRSALADLNWNDQPLVIGAGHAGNVNRLDGLVDEARFSTVARSADWIQAQYLSMTDAFVTYGPKTAL